jgi:mxaC protein
MNIGFGLPWVLPLLALAVVPLLRQPARPRAFPWLGLLPRDRWSDAVGWGLRALHALAIAFVVLALARPYRLDEPTQRVGRGAEIVILLDRSRSMDQAYNLTTGSGAERIVQRIRGEPKASVARRLLAQFAARRTEDRFGLVAFSTQPIPILGLTRKPELIAAALAASDVRPALGDTDIGRGLLGAIRTFDNQPYRGSRVILLASDGGGHIDEDTQREIALRLKRARITLYWLYIRSFGAPSLTAESSQIVKDTADVVAEQSLHRFFSTMGSPYRAFQADSPTALQEAIDEVGRLENAPLEYAEIRPRREFEPLLFGCALGAVLLLVAARRWELAA